MDALEQLWPDDDRREAAILRVGRAMATKHLNEQPTPHELRIITARSHGLGTRGSAEVLGLSYEAVKSSLRLASRRVGAKDTPHLISICMRKGWID